MLTTERKSPSRRMASMKAVSCISADCTSAAPTIPGEIESRAGGGAMRAEDILGVLEAVHAGHVDPAEAVHVHVAPERLAGTVSVIVVAIAAEGPAFEATMV